MVGPSFFTVRQELATVRAPQDISELHRSAVSIRSVTVTDVKDSPVGINVGVDGTYLITRIPGLSMVPEKMVGVGAFVRYVGASIDLPSATGVTLNWGSEAPAGSRQESACDCDSKFGSGCGF